MKIYKNFSQYQPESGLAGVMYLKDEDGHDWYNLQQHFSGDTTKIVFDSTGLIIDAKRDVSAIVPVDMSVAELSDADLPAGFTADTASQWQFDGKAVTKKPLTAEECLAKATAQRQSLLDTANSTISFWQTKLLAGKTLTEDQKTKLDLWLEYMDELEMLDFGGVSDEAAYNAIAWPDRPE
ncbi:hypothetical protein NG99_04535 [Erwinia typographi]|uniref:Tail fiber assembly protein n=1 Tax=Erwinia typographi TaxID=371042 RepID=A0A0A3ZCB0_9GAMM|nr:tail assembly chaperone [Erwinia typographi]KGT95291.1 hypothetical protein NG99_04535 [Erwinia typographi]